MNDLSPAQLRRAASKLRERYRPPTVSMRPGEYVSHETINEFAAVLDQIAEEDDTP